MEDRGGAKEGTPELYFTDPDGILIQLQDVVLRRRRLSRQRVPLVAFFLSGAAGLIFEMIWLHRSGLVFGNALVGVFGSRLLRGGSGF